MILTGIIVCKRRGPSIQNLVFAMLLFSSGSSVFAQQPTSVTVAGSLQSELGCPGDWQPECAATHLVFDADDNVWQGTFDIPAGNWEYKAALNDSWNVNYGANAQQNGPNIGLNLGAQTSVKFYYDHTTHWVTDNVNSRIVTVPGSYQTEIGCPGDWDPSCLRSWLQDPDGDGIYSADIPGIPAGSYEAKVTINESWDENYGAGGVQNGASIQFTVSRPCGRMHFEYDSGTHILTVAPAGAMPQPSSATVAGSLQSELGCPGDWQPDCAIAHLVFDADDNVWQGTFDIPAGNWEYKAALNDSWDVNYGANAQQNGPNIGLNLVAQTSVKFYYDHTTHWVTDNVNSRIVTVPGSYQSEIGCPGDWDPSCLRGWLQDPDGDGIYSADIPGIPAGSYEAKVTINESWDENYGAGGVPNGPNIPFSVSQSCSKVHFSFNGSTNTLTVTVTPVTDLEDASGTPNTFALGQNYPNPFNPSTAISYQLPVVSGVKLVVFDLLGREVATLVDGLEQPGYSSVEWNAAGVATGVYLYRLTAGDFVQTRKLLLLK